MKGNNSMNVSSIKNLRDLNYKKKLLRSRIEHQEILISYQVKNLREYYSPQRLLYVGIENLVAKNPKYGFILKIVDLIRSFNHK